MDEIRNQCARLLSDDFDTHSEAYGWLNSCRPFVSVLHRFQEHDMTLFDVADLLRPGSARALSDAAVWMLDEELRANAGRADFAM